MMIKKGKAFLKLKNEIEKMVSEGETSIDLNDLLKLMEEISYEEFCKRLSGKEVAEELTDFVNSSYDATEKDFVNTILTSHRTLQQSVFRLFIHCINGWAEMYDKDWFDGRNRVTCELSKEISERVKDVDIPLI